MVCPSRCQRRRHHGSFHMPYAHPSSVSLMAARQPLPGTPRDQPSKPSQDTRTQTELLEKPKVLQKGQANYQLTLPWCDANVDFPGVRMCTRGYGRRRRRIFLYLVCRLSRRTDEQTSQEIKGAWLCSRWGAGVSACSEMRSSPYPQRRGDTVSSAVA